MLFLSGCVPVLSKIAPDLFIYPKDQQAAVAAEVAGGYCPVSTEWLKDYMVVRDQIRGKLITKMED